MATKYFTGAALPVAQLDTLTIGGTWAQGETLTLTINGRDLVLTVGSTATTAQIALDVADMVNGADANDDEGRSELGSNVPEFAEVTATAVGSTVQFLGNTKGRPFSLSVAKGSSSGTVGNVTTIEASGPEHWDVADNWSGGSLPTGGVNEEQLVNLASGSASGGTFTLTFSGQTTSALDWNATAATVQAALEALSTGGVGNFSVSGTDITSTGYTVTFQNGLGLQNVAQMTVADGSLTGSSPVGQVTTTQAGSTGDDCIIELDTPVRYGLDDSSRHLNSITFRGRFGESLGAVGLPEVNEDGGSYTEYRSKYLSVGATTLAVDCAARLLRFNLSAIKSTVRILQTGTGEDGYPACLLKHANAYSTMYVEGSSEVGVAYLAGETATIPTVTVAEQAQVAFGSGCTLTTVTLNSGSLQIEADVTTLTMLDGAVLVKSGGITTLTQRGGLVDYQSTGTLGTANLSGAAVLTFENDSRAKTVTNPLELHGEQCQVYDYYETVSGLTVDFNNGGGPGQVRFGVDYRLVRSATS